MELQAYICPSCRTRFEAPAVRARCPSCGRRVKVIGNIPEDLRFSTKHSWLRLEDGLARVGITDYCQAELGPVVHVDLPTLGKKMTFMENLARIDPEFDVGFGFSSPVSGEVMKVNSALWDSPELVNSDPYGDGWLILVRLSRRSEVEELLSAAE